MVSESSAQDKNRLFSIDSINHYNDITDLETHISSMIIIISLIFIFSFGSMTRSMVNSVKLIQMTCFLSDCAHGSNLLESNVI